MPNRFRPIAPVVAVLAAACCLLTGCATSRVQPSSATGASVHLQGHVHGGQQPVTGSLIQLYAAGATGLASASTPLLTAQILTDDAGGFDITGDYTCPSATTQVYISASGGNPGLSPGGTNPTIALVAALGDCGNLTPTTTISISELTTVAAAWSLAPFATSLTSVGASSTNLSGIRNAMLTAGMLVDTASNAVPSAALPANATVESAKIVTLANLLAACVNSDGTSFCPQLFQDASLSTASTLPADTFQAALSIAQTPTNNVATLFSDPPPHSAFGGGLSHAPSDWTLSITYTGGGLSSPTSLAVDATGNVWVASAGGALSSFSPQGVPVWQNGITGNGLDQSSAITIDPSSNLWVANTSSISVNSNNGSVTSFAQNGYPLSGANGFISGNIAAPDAIAADANGNIWVANPGSASVTLLDASGNPLSGVAGFGQGIVSAPSALTVDPLHQAWIADVSSGLVIHMDSAGNILSQTPAGLSPSALALDSAGKLWATDFTDNLVSEIDVDGTLLLSGLTDPTLNAPSAIAVDGGDHLWLPNILGNTLTEFAGTNSGFTPGSVLGAATGIGLDANLLQPAGISADASGNLWVASLGNSHLVAFIGVATPTQTPQIGLPTRP